MGYESSGDIVVWGDDTYRQIRDRPPASDPGGDQFRVAVPGGGSQSLAIRKDGSLFLWGGGAPGKPIVMALPSKPPLPGTRTSPTVLGTDHLADALGRQLNNVQEASLSVSHFAAFCKDGSVVAWGVFAPPGVPVAPTTPMMAIGIATGGSGWVAITPYGRLRPWGVIATPPTPPTLAKGSSRFPRRAFTKVAGRNDYVLALDNLHRLYMWGHDFIGTYAADWPGWTKGPGDYYWIDSPDSPFKEIAAGLVNKDAGLGPHILALSENGAVHGWGANEFGQAVPPSGVKFTAIAAGRSFSVGIDYNENLRHWGDPGPKTVRNRLDDVPLDKCCSVSAGDRHATAVRSLHYGGD